MGRGELPGEVQHRHVHVGPLDRRHRVLAAPQVPVRGAEVAANFNITSFERHIHAERVWHKTFEISRKKDTYWVFTLYEFPDEACGCAAPPSL